MPIVSVIIPNYNHEAFLEKRIESCLFQTFTDFEIIILDDASSDNSKNIIERYRRNDKVSQIMYNETNSGSPFRQWQKGLAAATGKYIWIAESDDYAERNFLEVLMKPFHADDDVAISYCRSAFADENGRVLGPAAHADLMDSKKWTTDYIAGGASELRHYLRYQNTIPNASAVVFKKPADINAALDTNMQFCGDWVFWKNLLRGNAKVAYTATVLNFFRSHIGTTRSFASASTKARELKRFREYRKLVPALYLNPLDNRCRWMMEEWINRGDVFKDSLYKYVPLLHPALAVRYYLYLFKKFISPKAGSNRNTATGS